ncbi:type II toxin-antitoxin system RelB family antitoxin [Dryocola sp. BD613]|uniref:type II toxin-antitoxin system RelB family antitoxin n=1 Tax=Dryocola sp. BD613 TaxID=3133272 RepID=UPI003F5044B9
MGALFSPIVSEFESEEQASSYDRWFRDKVKTALDDPRDGVPHDQLMAEMDAIIAAAESRMNKQG